MIEVPNAPRLLIEARLQPIQGTRFQPTGFPDLGAATYTAPGADTQMILLESAQSVANRLEAVCWDEGTGDLRAPLQGMPYVRVLDAGGEPLTNSILEAHRLNSPYIAKAEGFAAIKEAVGFDPKRPFERRKLAAALMRFDPNSLIHGAFMEKIAGVVRLPRMLSGFIEAEGVQVVSSGGVKNDRVSASGDKAAKQTAKEGFGNVPFHRSEYAAKAITAYFNLDLTQLRGLGLSTDAQKLLYALAIWKVHMFITEGLRLRTACDLDALELKVTRPKDFTLPTLSTLQDALPTLITTVTKAKEFAEPARTDVIFGAGK